MDSRVVANGMRLEVEMGAQRTMLLPMFVIGFWTCSAQQITIPFEKIEKDASLSATLRPPAKAAAVEDYSVSSSLVIPAEPSMSGADFTRIVPPARVRPFIGLNFYLLNGLHLGMAVADVEITQHCISTRRCRESNPLVPSSQAGALSVNIALVGYGAWLSHGMKRNRSRLWWLSPTSGIAGHVAGIIAGAMNQ